MQTQKLYDELKSYKFANWMHYTIIMALIDAGRITSFECQADQCLRESRAFAKSGKRGQGDLLTIDHIVQKQHGGSHHVDNLRIMHQTCNSAWRRGLPGPVHSAETRQKMSDGIKRAHAEGRMTHIYTPERSQKISETFKRKREAREQAALLNDSDKDSTSE